MASLPSNTQLRTINMAGQIVLREEESDDDEDYDFNNTAASRQHQQHSPLTLPSSATTVFGCAEISSPLMILPTSSEDSDDTLVLHPEENELAPGWVWGFGAFRNHQTYRSEKLQQLWSSHKEKKKHNNNNNGYPKKKFLGRSNRFSSLTVDDADDEADDNRSSDDSLLSNETTSLENSSAHSPSKVSVLVEIPEELEGLSSSSAAVDENFGSNLMDMDNYMLSVFHMNDEASVCQSIHTMTTADTGFSSSTASSVSTRRRHRGACGRRRGDLQQRQKKGAYSNRRSGSWLESMKESSKSVLQVDGKDSWTPSRGWHAAAAATKTPWDAEPDGCWEDATPIFDAAT